ncbi:ubn1 [Pungitius sinensis]
MAESRRVQLTTLSGDHGPASPGEPVPVPGPAPPSVPAPRREPPAGDPPEKAKGSGGTVRLELTLFEADERSFPEFSYTQLVDIKTMHTEEKVQLSRFEEQEKRENEEITATLRKLERKYGNEPKKKYQDRIQDLIDIGFGYDEEDSFIDNSEAYDEFVPAAITTKFGGFYVNSGVLHFRQASEAEDLATEEETLDSSDFSTPRKPEEVNGGPGEPTKKRCGEEGTITRNVDPTSRTLSEAGPVDDVKRKKKKKKKKKTTSAGPLSVTSMLKKFQREKAKERQKTERASQKSPVPGEPCPADAGGGSGQTDPLLSLIGSTDDHAFIQAANAVDLDIDLDSLLDVTEQTTTAMWPPPKAEAPLLRAGADDGSRAFAAPRVRPPDTETNSLPKLHPEPVGPSPQGVQLPEGLPSRLGDSIRKLTAVAKTSEGESKLKFFTPEINSVLLDIEVQCREQGVHLRSKVYTHLSSFLPCSRDTLLKRVKKLFLAQREDPPGVDDPLQKLREAVGRAMPDQIERFNQSCVAYEQIKTLRATEEKVNFGPEDHVEEKGGRRGGGPKKSFQWNEEIRGSLCEVLRVRMERCKTEGKGSQEMEHHLKTMLDNEVKPLWPKGWMQSRVLIRESRKMLSLFTSLLVKRVRPEKRPRPIGAQSDSCGVPHGPPPLKRLLRVEDDDDDVVVLRPDVDAPPRLAAEDKGEAAQGAVSPPPAEVNAAATPSHLDVLADQALAREQHLLVSQELLAAAVAKYKHSVQRWGFGGDAKSPPLSPRPPQSSPVGFPLGGTCRGVLPQMVHFGDFARHMDASHVQIISDDDDVTIQ